MNVLHSSNPQSAFGKRKKISIWQRLHFDGPLLAALVLLVLIGLAILYSAANQNAGLVQRQVTRLGLAFFVLIIFAQISPNTYRKWSIRLYSFSLLLLVAVLVIGYVGKGAQRWLDLGFIRFQPSELMKLALPMALAWYLETRTLPPSLKEIALCGLMILVPVLLTAKQPDLGTALLIGLSSFCILFLAGLSWRLLAASGAAGLVCIPALWYFMHNYQRTRILTFLNPERDPLGAGYHIIQSKIAIGSGGLLGKGWLHGTQSHLHFLPEHATDFIFAVSGEEFGLIGSAILLAIYLFIVVRCLLIASQAQNTYTRLLAGGLSLMFFLSMFVNIGMVCGILPVVGLPLPLISYGGTSMVTLMASFGILMSIQTHRKLLGT